MTLVVTRILYKNQFQLGTDKTDYQERLTSVCKKEFLVRSIFQEEIVGKDEMPGTLFTGSLPEASPTQYKTPTQEEQSTFKQLKEVIENFKKDKLPQLAEDEVARINAQDPEQFIPDPLKKFESDLISFLDQHPQVSQQDLTSYLEHYSLKLPLPPASRTLSRTRIIDEVETSIRCNPNLPNPIGGVNEKKQRAKIKERIISTFSDSLIRSFLL